MTETHHSPEAKLASSIFTAIRTRLLVGGEYLNPQKKDLPPVTADLLGKTDQLTHTNTLIQRKSLQERDEYWRSRANSDSTLNQISAQYAQWKKEMILQLNHPSNKDHAEELKRIHFTGSSGSEDDIDKLYQRYFSDSEHGAELFMKDILEAYRYDLNLIAAHENTIRWIASTFGSQSSRILEQFTFALAHLHTEQGKTALVSAANETQQQGDALRINSLSQEEELLLNWLYNSQNAVVNRPEPTGTQSKDLVKPEIPYRSDVLSVEQQFSQLETPVDINDEIVKRWFVSVIPERRVLTDNEIRIITVEPKNFVAVDGKTDKSQNPHVWDFYDEQDEVNPKTRFMQATKLTSDDSGLLSLCAVAAVNPKEQAKLYQVTSDMILQISEKQPELILEWFKKQSPGSLSMFTYDDQARRDQGQSEDYVLVPLLNGAIDENHFMDVWKKRLIELRQAVDRSEFTLYHHRWLEALSRTIDIKKLFSLLGAHP